MVNRTGVSLKLKTVTDGVPRMNKRMVDLSQVAVLVGIPEDHAQRPKGEPINNAELTYILTNGVRSVDARRIMGAMQNRGLSYGAAQELYIQSRGSMAFHIPPRPIIEPAVEANTAVLIPELKIAATEALDGNRAGTLGRLKRVGLMAQNLVRGWFTDPRNHWAPNAPSTIKAKGSDRPNIDLGELRKQMTYVVTERK